MCVCVCVCFKVEVVKWKGVTKEPATLPSSSLSLSLRHIHTLTFIDAARERKCRCSECFRPHKFSWFDGVACSAGSDAVRLRSKMIEIHPLWSACLPPQGSTLPPLFKRCKYFMFISINSAKCEVLGEVSLSTNHFWSFTAVDLNALCFLCVICSSLLLNPHENTQL